MRSLLIALVAIALVGCGNDDSKLSQARGFGAGPGFTQQNAAQQGGAATFSSATVTGDTTLADLTDQGAFVLTGSIAPAAVTGEIHDWNPCDATTTTKCLASAALSDRTSLVRIALSGNLTVDSLAAPSPATGQVTCFENTSSTFSATFLNEESVNTTSALDRLTLPNSASWVVPPNGGACMRYSAAATRWKPWQSNNNNLMGTSLAVTGTSTLAGVTATSINDSGSLAAGASTLGATTVTTLGLSSIETGSTAQSAEVRGDAAASSTVPTLIPNQADTTTGIGAGVAGALSLIIGGTERFKIDSAFLATFAGTNIQAGNTSGFTLRNTAASATTPTLCPTRTSTTSGIGADATGDVSLIAGGVEIARATSTGLQVLLDGTSLSVGSGTNTALTISLAGGRGTFSYDTSGFKLTGGSGKYIGLAGNLATNPQLVIASTGSTPAMGLGGLISSGSNLTGATLVVTANHLLTFGTALTTSNLSACGTTPAIDAGSTDVAGQITEGTTATGCTLAFANTYTVKPYCTCTASTNITVGCVASATALTIVNSSASGDVITYNCVGQKTST